MAELIGERFTSADPFNTSFSALTRYRKRVMDEKQDPTPLWRSERCT